MGPRGVIKVSPSQNNGVFQIENGVNSNSGEVKNYGNNNDGEVDAWSQKLNLTCLQKFQIIFMSVTMAPIRLIAFFTGEFNGFSSLQILPFTIL